MSRRRPTEHNRYWPRPNEQWAQAQHNDRVGRVLLPQLGIHGEGPQQRPNLSDQASPVRGSSEEEEEGKSRKMGTALYFKSGADPSKFTTTTPSLY
jgi:hypothetical protein